ncbi:hypothetical protein FD724_17360 [Nostoc sp. C057]|nr:hypothetical protein FD724_17360 [Nostoc sp. C057]
MMVKYQPPKRVTERARAIATIPLIIRDQGIEVLNIGHWELGIGHWALGIGYGALGMGHWVWGIGHGVLSIINSSSSPAPPASPALYSPFPIPHSLIQFLTTEDKNGINGSKGLRKAARF